MTGLSLFALIFPHSPAAQTTQSDQQMPEWISPPAFTYSAQGKPDPFRPVIRSQPDEVKEKEKPRAQLSPLEKVQPSQLQLVGIISNEDSNAHNQALVELPNGKGYILTLGVPIGQHQGRVKAITANSVVIQENITTIFGKTKKVDTILKLHKQPGQENG